MEGHSRYVNSVAFLPPSPECTAGLVISGGMDCLVLVWDPNSPLEPTHTLIGHTDNVCALAAFEDSLIVSGSWDKSARVWRDFKCIYTLLGHEQAVWSVLFLSKSSILTASADKSIKLWDSGKCVSTFLGHKDAVRSVARISEQRFVSCSNDGSLRVWDLGSASCLQELHGHTSFVYSVAVLPSGEFVSGGEDKTLRIWKDGSCSQTIKLPAQSIWTVCALGNGDVVSGANDGVIRVFSRDNSRVADAETLKNFDELVDMTSLNAKELGGIDKSKLVSVDRLQRPGSKDQEVVMVQVGTSVEAHQWSSAAQIWTRLGEVVDAVGSDRKQLFDGREYDFVFDVDISEGAPPLKLPYNASDNPYEAAQAFLLKNELPQDYLDQVANFILKNTSGMALGSGSTQGADPFTGAGRYVPSSTTSQNQQLAPNADPFTGNTQPSSQEPSVLLPLGAHSHLFFKAAQTTGAVKKIREFNSIVESKLSEQEFASLDKLAADLGNLVTVDYHAYAALIDKILSWPVDKRFPVFDLLRLLVLVSETFPAVETVLQRAEVNSSAALGNNVMLALRLLCNMFQTKSAKAQVLSKRKLIFEEVSNSWRYGKNNKNIGLAFSTLMLNFSIELVWSVVDEEFAVEMLSNLLEFLKAETDEEAQFRALVAIGNLRHKYPELSQILAVMDWKATAAILQQNGGRLAAITRQIL